MAAAPASAITQDSRLNAIASWIAQKPVSVRCETKAESAHDPEIVIFGAAAYVGSNEDGTPQAWTTVGYPFCKWAIALLDKRTADIPIPLLAFSVLVIDHESFHMRGEAWWGSEAQTECHAIRHYAYVAERFGIDPASSLLLLHWALYWDSRMSTAYKLPGCQRPHA